jgi:uncharacterized protein Yka (UPF0111/DUF47 family)
VEGDRVTRHRWFLPATPDVLGKLREQTAITMEGMEALIAWSLGESSAADRLRECEHQADDCKRELRAALTIAFTTPLEPEDIFELSTELDRVLNSAKNTIREAEVMGIAPDEAIAQMAAELANGVRDLNEAFEQLATGARAAATEAADRAAQSQSRVESSRVEKVYRQSMSALVAVVNLREVAAKRELYRRLARTSDDLREVAERVWYSVLKES